MTINAPRWLGKSPRALGIVRVSSKKQGDNNSPGVQREGITAHAQALGLHVVDIVMLEESAKSSDARVKFHAALARAKKEKVRHLVFWVWDRTTRNFTDYELLEDLIRRDEMVLHVAHERWQLHAGSDEGDWLKAEMNTLVAKTYSRQLSRRAKESQDAKAKDGWYPTRPPLGYRNAKLVGANGVVKDRGGTIVLLAEGRALLRRMYELRLAGRSLDAIGQAVVADGLWAALGRKNRRLVAGDIEHILKHEFYAGWFSWRDERYRGKHEPVFTQDEWERLQATFGHRAPYGSPLETGGALQGFMTCAECGCLITYDPKIKASGKRYDYYRCSNGHRVHHKRVHVTEAQLLAQFEAAIANIEMPHALADEISRVLRETHEVMRTERRREIGVLKRTVEDLQAREDKVVGLYVDGKLDDVTYQRQRDMLMSERHAALDRLSAASEDLDDKYLVTADRTFELAKQARTLWNQRTPAERRQLLEMVLSNPRLDGVTVRYDMKKPFAILSEMTKGNDWRARCDSNALQL
ncbi:MAG: recombinase family protein [Deltaproteobacteria bacterium]|nr:recombinase family protein [Deltaproteobacteria bacterium]